MIACFPKAIFFAGPLLLAIIGCGSSSGSGVKIRDSIWSTSKDDYTPGIEAGSVSDVTLKSGSGIRFVVWTDLPGWSGSGGGSPSSYQGQHTADGRKLAVHAETNGESATVTIAGTKYDSVSGALFLVSTTNDPPTVVQIDLDAKLFPSDSNQFAEFARDNDAICKFFQDRKKRVVGGN